MRLRRRTLVPRAGYCGVIWPGDSPVYRVEQEEPSKDFKEAWSTAGRHIQSQAGTGLSWIRATLDPNVINLSRRCRKRQAALGLA